MAVNPATKKQLDFLKKLSGQDYSNQELTASEASAKIEKALANKAQDVADADLPQQEPTILPKHKEVIKEAREEAKKEPSEPPPPDKQAVGMITKEIGEMIRAKLLVPIFGDEISVELLKWYRGQTLGITRVQFDRDKLPKFGVKPEKD